jgi:hypothetical protein
MIIDTDTNCTPHTKALKDRGVTHIGRYYAARGSKRITRDEAQALSKAGMQVFVVYEACGFGFGLCRQLTAECPFCCSNCAWVRDALLSM